MPVIDKPIGIDLGTTNSAVAVMNATDSEVELYRDRFGRLTTPSCVTVDARTGAPVVGRQAYNLRGHPNVPEPITSIKRRMGFPDPVRLGDAPRTPPEISALIVRELKRQMEEHLAQRGEFVVRRAVITVPAYFSNDQKTDTRQAGELAGLEVLDLLAEPTASAMYHAWLDGAEDALYMVYDLGGGTFDVSIVQKVGREFKTLGISGDNFLGGDDFDRRLVDRVILPRLRELYRLGLDPADPAQRWKRSRLVALAESVKIGLSKEAVDYYTLDEPAALFADDDGEPVYLHMDVTRADLVEAIEDKVLSTLPKAYEALERANAELKRSKADTRLDMRSVRLALVGGSTLIPYVQQVVLEQLLDGDPSRLVTPLPRDATTCVAMGAAIKAATHGTTIMPDRRHFQIALQSYCGTREVRHTVHGRVTAVDEGLDLGQSALEVVAPAGGFSQESRLQSDGRFAFRRVPLAQEAVNRFDLVLRGPRAEELGRVPIAVLHSARYRPLPTELGPGEPLARPWRLDVVERVDGADRLVRQDLLPVGTRVPARESHTFATWDQAGTIRLSLYEAERLIRVIQVSVPQDLPVGSDIELSIGCDEKYLITVDGCVPAVPGATFQATIEPPPPPPLPTRDELEALRNEFEQALEYVRAPDRKARLAAEFQALYRDMLEAFAAHDEPMLRQRMLELQAVVSRAMEPEPEIRLEPPKDQFDALALRVRLLILEASVKGLPNLDFAELRDQLALQRQLGEEAFKRGDQAAYSDAYQALATLHEVLRSVVERDRPPVPELSASERAWGLLHHVRRKHQEAARHALLSWRPEYSEAADWQAGLRDRLKAIGEGLREVERLVSPEPEAAIQRLQALDNDLENLRRMLDAGPPDKVDIPSGTPRRKPGAG